MKKLSRGHSPSIKEIQKVTGWSVPEMAAFFGIGRKAIYEYNRKNDGCLPRGRWFELMAKKPSIFAEETERDKETKT